ncbi:MAG: hypothetical protein H7832_13850 [Magnetococcus sp. DMHC-6]
MAAAKVLMLKVEGGAAQASQLSGLAGKTYTVGQVSSTGTGLSKWLFLNPINGAAAQTPVAVKIEGTRQIAELSSLAGKTVTVAKSPTVVGGMGKWLVLLPAKNGATATAVAAATGTGAVAAATGTGAGAAAATKSAITGSSLVLMKLEGTAQATEISTLTGKTFTVLKPPAMGTKAGSWLFLQPTAGSSKGIVALQVQHGGAGQISALYGKTILLDNAPVVAGKAATGKWILLNPIAAKGSTATVAAVTAKGAASATATKSALAAKPLLAAPTVTVPAQVATTAEIGQGAVTAMKSAAAGSSSVAAKGIATATSGTIWKGTGLSLGLGLGLGAWGPVLLAGVTGLGIYGIMKARKASQEGELEELIT